MEKWPQNEEVLTSSAADLINELRQHRVAADLHDVNSEITYYTKVVKYFQIRLDNKLRDRKSVV